MVHNVNVIKAVVMTVLVVTAFIGILVLYLTLNSSDRNEYENEFNETFTAYPPYIDVTGSVACQCGLRLKEYAIDPNGILGQNEGLISNAIFGGAEAEINSIPWQVGLKVFNQFPYCGGTIIGPMTILTAAHCVDQSNIYPSSITILVAEHDWRILNETNSFEIDVETIHIHPLYDAYNILFDYAILKTKKSIPFSKTVNAACLPNPDDEYQSKTLQTSGWGKVSKQWDSYLDAHALKTATIKSIQSKDCCRQFNNDFDCNTHNVVIDDSILCAGSSTEKVGVCFGDSGGPLIYDNGTHGILVGVTSYVVGACGTLGVVDGFAKVSHQLDWIRDLGDDYVKTCSAKLPLEYQCNQSKFCSKDNEQCVKNKCQCKYGFVRINGDCLDECQSMESYNRCTKGVYKADYYGWTANISIPTGASARDDWCFCLLNAGLEAFEITYLNYKIDRGSDKLQWFSSYKKMPSKLALNIEEWFEPKTYTIYSNVLQAMWFSDSVDFSFNGVEILVKAI